jgi:AcrR family transcriptional regulator
VATTGAARLTAAARREAVLDAAVRVFARRGLHGSSTEEVARAAGISQPYVFRLFGTKKELFVAAVERCLAETHDTFLAAADGRHGADALAAMGAAYRGLVADRSRLLVQLQAYAACDDPDVRAAVRAGYRRLQEMVERVSGASPQEVTRFFATGMLLNVVAALDLLAEPEPWGLRLLDGCRG